jgi:hypothetical protein
VQVGINCGKTWYEFVERIDLQIRNLTIPLNVAIFIYPISNPNWSGGALLLLET